MNELIKFSEIESKILEIRGQQVLIDRDVAELYGVEVKRVNEAVARNFDKFPDGYIISISQSEKNELVANCDRFTPLKHSTVTPTAFTEKGLYMLATILKSPRATETTLAIIETFAKVRELTRVLHNQPEEMDENQQATLMKTTGGILADVLDLNSMDVTEGETTLEFNLAFAKFKHTVKREKRRE